MSKYSDASFILPQAPYIKAGEIEVLKPTSGSVNLLVDRNSKATYKDVGGLLKEAAINVPRYNYNEVGGCPELLIEGQSTNLLKWSNNFTESSWSEVQTGTSLPLSITPNSSISPDGNNNATRIVFDLNGGVSASDRTIIRQSLGVVLDVIQSVWLKSYSGATQKILWHVGGDESEFEIGSEWTRFSYYKNTAFCGLSLRGGISSVDTCDILLYQYQGEENLFPTSEIYTESAIATRLKDEITGGGDVNTFNSLEGTFVVSSSSLSNSSNTREVSINDGTSSNRVGIRYSSIENKVEFVFVVSSATVYFHQHTLLNDSTDEHTFRIDYKSGLFVSYINNIEVDRQDSGLVPPADTFNQLTLGGSEPYIARTKFIQYYKEIQNY